LAEGRPAEPLVVPARSAHSVLESRKPWRSLVTLYEMRAYVKNRRGRLSRVKTLTIQETDPHAMAIEFWRISRLPGSEYLLEIRDLGAGRGALCPLVTYEELLRRARSSRSTG
jgi:hypothetical protein